MMMLNMNRSSCASGSGYVPSSSIGFCVANTRNGSSSLYVLPCTVTRCSCIASSSADCVFGGVRLISSASTMFAKIGPGVNTMCRRPVSGSSWMMSVPVMSLGIRSGVNWMRENLRSSTCAIVWIEQRLRESRHADDQAVAAGEQRQQHELDHVLLADDQLVQLGDDLVATGLEPVGERDVVGRFECGSGDRRGHESSGSGAAEGDWAS